MEVELIGIEKIIPYARNPRYNDLAIDKVASSLKEFGWKQPIVVDEEMVVIVGHTRLAAAKKLQMNELPVLIAKDLTPQQVKAYRIADNKTADYSQFDNDLLTLELIDLQAANYDLSNTGFETDEIIELLATEDEGLIDEDQVPIIQDKPISKLGDLYILGSHRLLCGDSTKQIDVEKLFDGAEADMCWTDPPYNIDYKGGAKRTTTKERSIMNDVMDNTSFYNFLYDAFILIEKNLKQGAPVYIAHASSESPNFMRAMVDAGLLYKQTLIWIKNRATLSRQDYNWQHEPILYGWKPGAAHKWYGDFDKTTVIDFRKDLNKLNKEELVQIINNIYVDVIDVERPSRSELHPTTKPIELVQKFIENSSKFNDIIYDPFGGSGSTLITAQKTGRQCYTVELDPKYVDVIVKRWEDYTGRKAELERD